MASFEAVDPAASEIIENESSETYSECAQSTTVGEFERSSFGMHLQRQAQLCKMALQGKYKYLPESVSQIGAAFEEYIFNPITDSDKQQREARMNFYPPFLIPECTACYSSFFSVLSLPMSCLANRTGTIKLQELKNSTKFDILPEFDSGLFIISDGLGAEVTAIDSLPRNTRLVNLELDNDRLKIMKQKLSYVTQFAYPALNLPPKIHKHLVSFLFKPYQSGQETVEEVNYAISDEVILNKLKDKLADTEPEKLILEFRRDLIQAIQYILPLKIMQAVFRSPSFVKKCQETLHYTFHHGFIKLIGEITKRNLSNFVTYHGMTFENKNNNPILHTTLDMMEGEDYIIDSIFLVLILTWQTLMGIWQQNLNAENMQLLENLLKARAETLVGDSADDMAEKIADWITDEGRLVEIFQKFAPDFFSQTQLVNFRQFILSRSNIVGGLVPALIKDFVPIAFKESPLRLWNHVYLLHISYFLFNHGDYCQVFFYTDEESKAIENEALCHCNLCAPHRMPIYNTALHNEILAIDSFDLVVPSKDSKMGQRVTLTPGMWANKYLDHFIPEEFFPFEVKKYLDHPEAFNKPLTACVITKPNVLSTIRALQREREKFLLEKGSGTYLDPETGDKLSDAKLLSQSTEREHSKHTDLRRTTKGEEEKKKKNTR